MIPYNVWTKSDENLISFFDESFADEADSFSLLFVRRGTCKEVIIPVDEVKVCDGQIKFIFEVECELDQGVHDLTLTNTTKDEIVFEEYPAIVYDVPVECVKNQS